MSYVPLIIIIYVIVFWSLLHLSFLHNLVETPKINTNLYEDTYKVS